MSRCIASRSRLGDRARRVAGEVVRVEHHTPQRDQPSSTNHTTATATRHAAAAAAGAAACRVVLAAPDAAVRERQRRRERALGDRGGDGVRVRLGDDGGYA